MASATAIRSAGDIEDQENFPAAGGSMDPAWLDGDRPGALRHQFLPRAPFLLLIPARLDQRSFQHCRPKLCESGDWRIWRRSDREQSSVRPCGGGVPSLASLVPSGACRRLWDFRRVGRCFARHHVRDPASEHANARAAGASLRGYRGSSICLPHVAWLRRDRILLTSCLERSFDVGPGISGAARICECRVQLAVGISRGSVVCGGNRKFLGSGICLSRDTGCQLVERRQN